nr:TaqI-like C-terminal specificity domain-containing protein [Streptococcus orisratti]
MRTAEIIRPILRGRDIKKFGYEFAELYLIYIPWHFPLHNDSSIQGASNEAERLFELKYPAVYNHLLLFKEQLSERNKSETGIRYEWYALQRWGANYWDDFNKPKIVYPNMTKFLPFYLDNEGFMVNQKCFILTGEKLIYLTSFLNSKVFKVCFKDYFPDLQGGTKELSKIFFERIPIPQIVKDRAVTDEEIYELYNFDEDEINWISSLFSE